MHQPKTAFITLGALLMLSLCSISFVLKEPASDKIRAIAYQGKTVKTTYAIADNFLGRYAGRKKGFLELRADGTGTYRYDVFGVMAGNNCKPAPITMEWGFLVDDNLEVVKFKRDYGYSYPILFKSTGETRFKGCREEVMLDFIMVYKDGSLGVSSSDDWKHIR